MISNYQIEFLNPLHYFYNEKYFIENYLKKDFYKWTKDGLLKFDETTNSEKKSININKEIEIKIKNHLGEQTRLVFLYERLKEEKYDAFEYINISLNLNYYISNLKFYQIIELLSILFKELPFVKFGFYEVGEKYGFGDNTIVKYENKIIKYFNIIHNEKEYSIYDYFIEYKSCKNDSELNLIVEEYINILNIEYEIYNSKLIQKQRNLEESEREEKYSIDDSYYDASGGDEWSDASDFW